MRIGRTLPPAAAPIPLATILRALPACFDRSNQSSGAFEEEIKQYFGSKYCFFLSSGKAAMTLILTALKELYPDRDEVLIPAFTCYSVPAAIKKAGLRIKLCDLAPSSLGFDKEQLQEIVSADKDEKKILCVLATHLFGCPDDLSGIREIIGSDIIVIEDAAQAMGEKLDDKKLGTIGDVGFFSLGRGKALSTMEGGVIISSRDDLGKKIGTLTKSIPEDSSVTVIKLAIKALLTSILQNPLLFCLPKGLPFLRLGETIYELNFSLVKISSFQRRLAWNWQERLDAHRKIRIANIQFWQDRLPKKMMCPCREYSGGSMIRLPLLAKTLKERNRLIELSEQSGLGLMPAYPTPIHEIPEIAEDFIGQQYPQARDICGRLFTVPVHEFVSYNDNKQIFDILTGKRYRSYEPDDN